MNEKKIQYRPGIQLKRAHFELLFWILFDFNYST